MTPLADLLLEECADAINQQHETIARLREEIARLREAIAQEREATRMTHHAEMPALVALVVAGVLSYVVYVATRR